MKDYNKNALFEFYKIKRNSSFKFTRDLECALQVSKLRNSNYKVRDIPNNSLNYKGASSSSSHSSSILPLAKTAHTWNKNKISEHMKI